MITRQLLLTYPLLLTSPSRHFGQKGLSLKKEVVVALRRQKEASKGTIACRRTSIVVTGQSLEAPHRAATTFVPVSK